MSAILRAVYMPPRFSGSGCRKLTTLCCSSSANCCLLERLSPVAMGTGLRRATSIIAGILLWCTGSSNHSGRIVDRFGELDSSGHVEPAMPFDEQIDRGPDGIPNGSE